MENLRKRSKLKSQFEFTMTGVLVTPNNMLYLCNTLTTKTKLLSGKNTKSQVTHSIRASRHRPDRKIPRIEGRDDYGNSIPTRPHEYMSDEDTSRNSRNGFENLTQD